MKKSLVCLSALLISFVLGSCGSTKGRKLTSSERIARDNDQVTLSASTRAVVRKGSTYLTRSDEKEPAVRLKEGSMLLVKNKDGAACEIMAGPATVRLIGTTVLTEKQGSVLRIINVEGRSRVKWGLRAGEYRMLGPGEMLLVDESSTTLPHPVLVDLNRLVSREEMLSGKFLGSEKLAAIDEAVQQQTQRIASGRLRPQSEFFAAGDTLEKMQGQTSWNNARMVDTTWHTAAGYVPPGTNLDAAVSSLVTSFLR